MNDIKAVKYLQGLVGRCELQTTISAHYHHKEPSSWALEETWFLTFFGQGSPHHVLPDIILLSQIEELANLAGPLGTKTARDSAVGQPGNVLLT